MKWLGLFLVLLVLLSGCQSLPYAYVQAPVYMGKGREIVIWEDLDFGEADRLEIEKAVEQWNFVLNGHLHLKVVRRIDHSLGMKMSFLSLKPGEWLFLKIDGTYPHIPATDDPFHTWTIGFTDHVGGRVLYLVRDRVANQDVFGLTMHEIGHLLGARHLGDRLMFPDFSRDRYQCVDWRTARQVAEHWGFRPGGLSYCVPEEY